MNSLPVISTGKRKASENLSAEHVTFRQSNLALNPPSIYFDKPKKSTEKSDDEGNYKKSKFPSKLGMRTPKISKRKFVYLEITTPPQKLG